MWTDSFDLDSFDWFLLLIIYVLPPPETISLTVETGLGTLLFLKYYGCILPSIRSLFCVIDKMLTVSSGWS